jgi:GTP-binding protein HflX
MGGAAPAPTRRERSTATPADSSLPRRSGQPPERCYLLAVEAKGERGNFPAEQSLQELARLVTTAGGVVVGSTIQHVSRFHPATLAGKGKLEELVTLRETENYDTVVVDSELSPTQQRNLEETLKCKVLDRSALILDIFAQRAHTKEAQLQVELAQLEYLLPRLAGMFTFFSRSAGAVGGVSGIATRGPGETQLETDRRHIRQRIARLHRELEEVRRTRQLHRARRAKQGLSVVSMVGYTNAGKSTLMNRLTGAGVLAENKLFATLEPTTRRVTLPSGQEVLLTDTVGFIQKLPPKLVAAFQATLEELEEAELLLVLVDVGDPNHFQQYRTVVATLNELKLQDAPRLTVLNKVDVLVELPLNLLEQYPGSVAISAQEGIGLDALAEAIGEALNRQARDITVHIPFNQPELVQLFQRRGQIEREDYSASGTTLQGRLPQALLSRFRPYVTGGGK